MQDKKKINSHWSSDGRIFFKKSQNGKVFQAKQISDVSGILSAMSLTDENSVLLKAAGMSDTSYVQANDPWKT